MIGVQIEYYYELNDNDMDAYFASIPSMPGMIEAGKTAQEAFDQLMISLRVKILFDNNLSYLE